MASLRIVLYLSIGYMIAEAVGGWLTNSLSLLADAGHMLSDVAALGLSLFAACADRQSLTFVNGRLMVFPGALDFSQVALHDSKVSDFDAVLVRKAGSVIFQMKVAPH